jgi:RNA polymerase-binding transcription factor DksA
VKRTQLTAHDRQTYRRWIEELIARLSGGVTQLQAEGLRPTSASGPTGAEPPAHEADPAVRESEEEVARALLASEGHLLAEATAALERLDDGTFGTCQQCGHAIPRARLDAVPYARTCVRCAKAPESDEVDERDEAKIADRPRAARPPRPSRGRGAKTEIGALRQTLQRLIEIDHDQARVLEHLVERVEQSVGHLGVAPELGILASELAALLVQAKKMPPAANDTRTCA